MDEKIVKTIALNVSEKPDLIVKEGEYQGHPVLHLMFMGDGGSRPSQLTMGCGKIKMCLFAVDDLKKFYDKHSQGLSKKG